MSEAIVLEHHDCGLSELTADELACVSGAGDSVQGAALLGAAGAVGAATFGSTWGAVAVGAAFATAPLAVCVMAGFALYGAYKIMGR